ncbi:MAG: thioredoxin-dependent thiol peroxidase [Fimbriimonadaceae bacterium]|nr:thioredoxin-dependent thiol peroxidase [Alphaproteobacteria bacterium]
MAKQAKTTSLKTGDTAPLFTLPTDGGQEISLKALRGRNVVIYFYPKDMTSGCTKESIAFSENKAAFEAANTEIIGISADSTSSHDKFKAKHSLDLVLASDEEKKTIEDYGVWVEKNMYGRKYMGFERATFLIDADGKIAEIWRKVRVNGHVDKVLEAARQLT